MSFTRPITRIIARTPIPAVRSGNTLYFHMSGIPSQTAQIQKRAEMSSSSNTSAQAKEQELGIQSQVQTDKGVELSVEQKVVVGSVLDLFKGLPTKAKLALWTDDATFNDPLTQAQGRKQFEAQWYGLKAAFSEIEPLQSLVTSSGNPISVSMKTRYKIKGIGSEQTISSIVDIYTKQEGQAQRITKVEDKWDGSIPEGPFAKAFRNLNSVVVPAFVSVPKEGEER